MTDPKLPVSPNQGQGDEGSVAPPPASLAASVMNSSDAPSRMSSEASVPPQLLLPSAEEIASVIFEWVTIEREDFTEPDGNVVKINILGDTMGAAKAILALFGAGAARAPMQQARTCGGASPLPHPHLPKEEKELVEELAAFKRRKMRGLEGMALAYTDLLDIADRLAKALSSLTE